MLVLKYMEVRLFGVRFKLVTGLVKRFDLLNSVSSNNGRHF